MIGENADYEYDEISRSEEERTALTGFWYLDGKLDAESYFYVSKDGSVTYYIRQKGDPEAIPVSSFYIVLAAGDDPHGFYAVPADDKGGLQTFFSISPASENGEADKLILDNGGTVFIRME